MAKATMRDMYLQFRDVSVDLDASNSTTLVEDKLDTGLSIRGGIAWLIHLIEILFSDAEADSGTPPSGAQRLALSSQEGLAAMPELGDDGTICRASKQLVFATSGSALLSSEPRQLRYLPPIPYASPQIVLYAQTTADNTNLRSETVQARIGYTTVPMDSPLYAELAETWGG